jgi:hypothetical protein
VDEIVGAGPDAAGPPGEGSTVPPAAAGGAAPGAPAAPDGRAGANEETE